MRDDKKLNEHPKRDNYKADNHPAKNQDQKKLSKASTKIAGIEIMDAEES